MWWGILLFAALIAAGLYVLRRQTLVEFPLSGHAPGATVAPAAATPVANTSAADEIARLAALHDSGALSDEEYARAKNNILPA
jgi:hypothetical protein